MAENQQDNDRPARSPEMDPAEGARESVRNQGGIGNRGIDRERDEQQRLPERGKSQEELAQAIDSVDGGSNPADDDLSGTTR